MYLYSSNNNLIKLFYFTLFCIFTSVSCYSSNQVTSPNKKIFVSYNKTKGFKISYNKSGNFVSITNIPTFGLQTLEDEVSTYQLISTSDSIIINEEYQMLSGKRKNCTNHGIEKTYHFKSSNNLYLDVIFRVYNDGIAFRYNFPKLNNKINIYNEYTSFSIKPGIKRWTQKLNQSYEDFYTMNTDGIGNNQNRKWGFPALFEITDSIFSLFTEANIMRGNCGSWLSNTENKDLYRIEMAEKNEGCDKSWFSPWRVIIIGDLSNIVESTLVTDVSEPSKIKNTSWIKPGLVSWVYWAYNHGSKDFQIVKKYIDFAKDFKLPYVLIDWEWDEMANGGNLKDAVKYAISNNIKPLLWYNSSTAWCGAGPLYRLNSSENREKEFSWLNKLGIKGIKVDFFNQDSISTMNYFIDILEDAAKHKLLVNLHGATIPRGWQRTYPNMMSVEGVYGAEWYNNNEILTDNAAWHNCTLPFTRNVIGPMDYTPCTFTDSQYPHITSDGHELALLIVFESALQHLADKPEGYKQQPIYIHKFISDLPTCWDDTKLLSGYPSEYIVIARKKGCYWYIAGLNGNNKETPLSVNLDFIENEIKEINLYSDNKEKNQLAIESLPNTKKDLIIECLPRGGFVIKVKCK